MRIAVSFPGIHRRGGVERIALECARHLVGAGHDVTLVAADTDPGEPPGARVLHVDSRRRPGFLSGPSYFRRATAMLRDHDFDVINTHGCVCPLDGVHFVQSVHRAWLEKADTLRRPFSAAWAKQRLNPLHPLLLDLEARHFRVRRYRRLIATTPTVRADLHRLYGVPESDVDIIPNGYHPAEFNPAARAARRTAARARLGLADSTTALLLVANELHRKGYPTLLDAMRRLPGHDLRLIVVGRPDPAVVMAMARDAGQADRVIAPGAAGDVPFYHAAADLFVLPTQYEALSLAVLEALASGVPAVVSDVPGAADAVRPGVNGALLADPTDGAMLADILRPLLDPDARAALSAAAPASVAEYAWPVVLRRFERVLETHARNTTAVPA